MLPIAVSAVLLILCACGAAGWQVSREDRADRRAFVDRIVGTMRREGLDVVGIEERGGETTVSVAPHPGADRRRH